MKPGRELDALIAEKVMGLKPSFVVHLAPAEWIYFDEKENGLPVPHYSTDIAAAWQVVEKCNLLHDYHLQKTNQGEWGLWYGRDDDDVVIGDTPAHAICLAALKAASGSVKED